MKGMKKKAVVWTAVVAMTLSILPVMGCSNSEAKKSDKTATQTYKYLVNKKKKTSKEKCPVNKRKTDNKIYLYKVGTKNSKKTKTIRVHQTKYLKIKQVGKAKKIQWKSSNKKVATVSKNGLLTGLKKGKITITAKVKKSEYQIKIKVKKSLKIKGEKVNGSQLKQGIFLTDYYTPNENTLVSPVSVNMVLGMIANGSKGKVVCDSTCGTIPNEKITMNPKKEVEKYLGKSTKNYNEYAKKIMNSNDWKTLKMANSVWYRTGMKLNNTFETNIKNYYNAQSSEIPFNKLGVEQINKWVSDNTDGMIKKIINSTDRQTCAYILNATLFDGKWTNKFDSSNVRQEKFKLFTGKKVKTKMMYDSENRYYENDYALAFEKTYEKDKKYSFIGILPKAKGQFKLENLNIPQLITQKKKGYIQIAIPKFEYKWKRNIVPSMIDTGMVGIFNAFVPALNPMFITSDATNKYVNEIIHSAAIKVDTEGTKAAAVTSTTVKNSVSIMPKKKIVLNRPFAYLIRNNKTGEILFVGKVINPSK